MSSSNNAYQVNYESDTPEKQTQEVSEITQLDDEIVALSYIISALEAKEIFSISNALKDIVELHFSAKAILHRATQNEKDEYDDIIHSYLVTKYFNKIKLDKYKENVRTTIIT